MSSKEIYNDRFDEDEESIIGAEQGEDYEDEVNRELENEMEEEEEGYVKMEEAGMFPEVTKKEKRTKIIRRLVERPKTVYERFPAFEKGKTLNFTELFKGNVAKKSRIGKRPLQGAS